MVYILNCIDEDLMSEHTPQALSADAPQLLRTEHHDAVTHLRLMRPAKRTPSTTR